MLLFFLFVCFNFFFIRSKSEPWLQLTRSGRWTCGGSQRNLGTGLD